MSNNDTTLQTTSLGDSQIVLYQPDETISLEVKLEEDTVWLSAVQMTELFQTTKQNVSLHIKNIYKEGELQQEATVKESLTVQVEGNRKVKRQIIYYNLDVIISVGYRVKSQRGTQFRQWATNVLKQYLLKGYAVHAQLQHVEQRLDKQLYQHDLEISDLKTKVDFLVNIHQQPKESLFATGCMWDAYSYISNLIRSAKTQVILVDNYCNDKTLTLLDQRDKSVQAIIHTTYNKTFEEALSAHNTQQPPIDFIQLPHKIHDRFLIIDQQVYLLGNSLKDMGHTLSAAILTSFTPQEVLDKLK